MWTAPRTWVASELVTASIMNIHVRDNLLELKAGVMVTAIPGSPTNGDRVTLVDSLTAPTYAWYLRYISAAATYKWYCIGGSPAIVLVAAREAKAVGAYGALTTAGPSFTLPEDGDWDIVQHTSYRWDNGGGANYDCYMSYDIGGTGAVDADGILFESGGGPASHGMVGYRKQRKTGLTATTAIVSKYKTNGGSLGTSTWSRRTLEVMPFRVN